jgi:hypothetical protein
MQTAGQTIVVIGKHELLLFPQTEIDLTSGRILQNPLYN